MKKEKFNILVKFLLIVLPLIVIIISSFNYLSNPGLNIKHLNKTNLSFSESIKDFEKQTNIHMNDINSLPGDIYSFAKKALDNAHINTFHEVIRKPAQSFLRLIFGKYARQNPDKQSETSFHST